MSCKNCNSTDHIYSDLCRICRTHSLISIGIDDIKNTYNISSDYLIKNNVPSFIEKFNVKPGRRYLICDVENLICKLVDEQKIDPPKSYNRIIEMKNRKKIVTDIVNELLTKYVLLDEVEDKITSIINKIYRIEGYTDFSVAMNIVESINKENTNILEKKERVKIANVILKNKKCDNEFIDKIKHTYTYANYINGKISLDIFVMILETEIKKTNEKVEREKIINAELEKNNIPIHMASKYHIYNDYVNKNIGDYLNAVFCIKKRIDVDRREKEIVKLAKDKNLSSPHDYIFYVEYLDGLISLDDAMKKIDNEINKFRVK
jgi:hypothetical protein